MNFSVAINKSVQTFDGLDHQRTPEEHLHQSDAHIIFTMGQQPFDLGSYNQWHKRHRTKNNAPYVEMPSACFYKFLIVKNKIGLLCYLQLKNNFPQKKQHYAQVAARFLKEKETENTHQYALKAQQVVQKGLCKNLLQQLILRVMKFSLKNQIYGKTWLITGDLHLNPLFWSLPIHFKHWL